MDDDIFFNALYNLPLSLRMLNRSDSINKAHFEANKNKILLLYPQDIRPGLFLHNLKT